LISRHFEILFKFIQNVKGLDNIFVLNDFCSNYKKQLLIKLKFIVVVCPCKLQAHPALSDMERKKVCSLMDCQKLSREACAHAAQNDRLPVQTVVQVLYYEQQRLRDVMSGSLMSGDSSNLSSKVNLYSTDILPISDELSSLRRENDDLKIELVKMKMRLKEIEKSPHISAASSPMRSSTMPSADKPPLPRRSFMSSVSKKLGRLSPFPRADGITPFNSRGKPRPSKDRRHSIS
jgi:hypothetical protein